MIEFCPALVDGDLVNLTGPCVRARMKPALSCDLYVEVERPRIGVVLTSKDRTYAGRVHRWHRIAFGECSEGNVVIGWVCHNLASHAMRLLQRRDGS